MTRIEALVKHFGRSLVELEERHYKHNKHTRFGKLQVREDAKTNIYVFKECLDCAGVESEDYANYKMIYTEEALKEFEKRRLLIIISHRKLSGNKQTSKTKLIDTILKSY